MNRPSLQRPWDARLARWMIAPLIQTRISPNSLTTARLLVGLSAVAAFAAGSYLWTNIAALLVIVSNVLDHTDGELARATGKTSRFGHVYDLSSDALIHVLLFIGIGFGLRNSPLGHWAVTLGIISGCAVTMIFWLRLRIEQQLGKAGVRQPSFGGFEAEDVLYLIPLVTLTGGLQTFLSLAAVGAPAFLLWVVFESIRLLPAKYNSQNT